MPFTKPRVPFAIHFHLMNLDTCLGNVGSHKSRFLQDKPLSKTSEKFLSLIPVLDMLETCKFISQLIQSATSKSLGRITEMEIKSW